ncbi:hypothetical protein [Gordonia sp. CPCC 205333]|uniref:hypothetical protein n=1 Tax=Gordonia sp. CPCC 205333 TaxID=3140790 RepID=UPI003AF40717
MGRYRMSSARGRYIRGDRCDNCLGGEPRTSKLESDVFAILGFVLGPGEQDVRLPSDARMHLDMRFQLPHGLMYGFEYDGAYWHAGKEDADTRKAYRVLNDHLADVVIRIREQPLAALAREDVVVPHGASASTIASATLLHLCHLGLLDHPTDRRVETMLGALGEHLSGDEVLCDDCWALYARLPDVVSGEDLAHDIRQRRARRRKRGDPATNRRLRFR